MIISKEAHLSRLTFLFQFYWELLLEEKQLIKTDKELARILKVAYNNKKTPEQEHYENELVKITEQLYKLMGRQ
ncbi:MAG: hypothetical protein ACXACW_15875 [Candidatus Hodarchaeales archaeon]|jgi:hypothetical protein